MKISEIKKALKEYKDFYGGDLITIDEIDTAKTKKQLKVLVNRHESFMEDMLSDALSHISELKEETGLSL